MQPNNNHKRYPHSEHATVAVSIRQSVDQQQGQSKHEMLQIDLLRNLASTIPHYQEVILNRQNIDDRVRAAKEHQERIVESIIVE